MPKPVYIICSESGSEDRLTGLISHFKVVEQILLQESPPPVEGKPVVITAMPFQFMVVWAMSDDDRPGDEYEYCHSLFFPPGEKEVSLPGGTIFFEQGKPRYRFAMVLAGLTFKDVGIFKVESKIRRVGEESWLSQTYEIPVIKHSPPSQPEGGRLASGENGAPAEEPAP